MKTWVQSAIAICVLLGKGNAHIERYLREIDLRCI